jgi:acyl-CoA reductase-like NAD-dependent aldehyde dehydrogenase
MAAIATMEEWTALASSVDVPRRALVDEEHADALSGETFECRSPVDGRLLADVAACGAVDVDPRSRARGRCSSRAGGPPPPHGAQAGPAPARRAHRVSRAIRAGVVWVNTFDSSDITSPFGGSKQSGFGRDKSIHALEKYADLKTVWIGLRE